MGERAGNLYCDAIEVLPMVLVSLVLAALLHADMNSLWPQSLLTGSSDFFRFRGVAPSNCSDIC